MEIARPALRYFGGKWRIAPWIISHFPQHKTYVELFGGGASVLIRKDPSPVEVLNDLDGEVINFWRVLRDRTEELIRAITLTPFSREELDLAYEYSEDDLERARRLYVRSWQARGGPTTQWRSGWRFVVNSNRDHSAQWDETDHLWSIAVRLKTVYLEKDDALSVIRNFDSRDTLFYADPPYLLETRPNSKNAYTCEVDEKFHAALAEKLGSAQGAVVVSGYPSALYDRLYSGWKKSEIQTRRDTPSGDVHRTEVLWVKRGREDKQLEFAWG